MAIYSTISSFDIEQRHLLEDEGSRLIFLENMSAGQGAEKNVGAKCALLFFGNLDGFRSLSLPTIMKNVIRPNPHCDVFLHTFDVSEEVKADALLLTDNVDIEKITSFYSKRNQFLRQSRLHYHHDFEKEEKCCNSHDNMIKQWHSIQAVWELMRKNEMMKGKGGEDEMVYYEQVGLFKSDVYYISPINIMDSIASLPNHSYNWGYNDRMFYGHRKNAEVWADRFSFTEKFENDFMTKFDANGTEEKNNCNGYHSESFLRHLLREHDVEVQPRAICTWEIIEASQLSTNDCDSLEEYKSKKMEHLPPGYVLTTEETRAAHWSAVWDHTKAYVNDHGSNKMSSTLIENRNMRGGGATAGFMVVGMHQSGISLLASLMANGFGYKIGNEKLLNQDTMTLDTIHMQNNAFMWDQNLTWTSNIQQYDPQLAIEHLEGGSIPTSCGSIGLDFLNHPGNAPWLQEDARMSITLRTWLP